MKNIICLLETLAFVFGASFIVASDYEIVKTVSAMNGRTYSVSLNVDASISEED